MQKLKFHNLWFLLGLFWVSTVVYFSLSPTTPVAGKLWDKAQHFLTYGFLTGWFLFIAYELKAAYKYTIAIFILGVIIEILQGFVPERFPSFLDVIANTLGILVSLILVKFIFKIRRLLFYENN